jgi:molybdopterin molybdotransferase
MGPVKNDAKAQKAEPKGDVPRIGDRQSAGARDPARDLLPVEEARRRILAAVKVLPAVEVPILELRGQVLAEDVRAGESIPPFDNSAMDGYAVRAADVAAATPAHPIALEVVEHLPAGAVSRRVLEPGQAARIMTGAPIPQGADAVVMVEATDSGRERVLVRSGVRPGENLRRQGESLLAGEVALARGTALRPAEMAMLATLGRTRVQVIRRPQVALLSTGAELVPPDLSPGPGQIRDSNRFGLIGQVAELGCMPVDLGLAGDDLAQIRSLVARGLEEADCLITSGGVSVGDFDLTRRVLGEFGPVESWRVAMKPGMPQAFGVARGKPVFGLPGNPVSSMIVFDQFVRPALLKMSGHRRLERPRWPAILDEPIHKQAGKVHFLRAVVESRSGTLHARTTGPQGSGILKSLTLANALIILGREQTRVEAGETVTVELMVELMNDGLESAADPGKVKDLQA